MGEPLSTYELERLQRIARVLRRWVEGRAGEQAKKYPAHHRQADRARLAYIEKIITSYDHDISQSQEGGAQVKSAAKVRPHSDQL